MRIGRRFLTFIVAVVCVTSVGMAYASGQGERGGGALFRSSLSPSTPDDPMFHGVAPGGVPWVLERGFVKLEDSRIELRVRGLVIPIEHTVGGTTFPAGTALPVTTVSAALYCDGDMNLSPAFTSSSVPISPHGNARIKESVTIPGSCQAPIILLHPNGIGAAYIAVTGFGG